MEDLAHAKLVEKEEWQARSLLTKTKEKISGLFVPIL
jgi:cardiolipin synthase